MRVFSFQVGVFYFSGSIPVLMQKFRCFYFPIKKYIFMGVGVYSHVTRACSDAKIVIFIAYTLSNESVIENRPCCRYISFAGRVHTKRCRKYKIYWPVTWLAVHSIAAKLQLCTGAVQPLLQLWQCGSVSKYSPRKFWHIVRWDLWTFSTSLL